MENIHQNMKNKAKEIVQNNPDSIHTILFENMEIGIQAIDELMNQVSETEKAFSKSQEIRLNRTQNAFQLHANGGQKQNIAQVSKLDDLELAVKLLSDIHKNEGFEVVFKEKVDKPSQITMRMLISDMHRKYARCTQKLPNNQSKIKRSELANNPQKEEQFKKWYKKRVEDQFGVTNIKIDKVDSGKYLRQNFIEVSWITDQGENIAEYKRKKDRKFDLQMHRIFNKLHFAKDYFDLKGNKNYTEMGLTKSAVLQRGNWPYYMPYLGLRLGIDVSEYNDKKWIGGKGEQGQWPVAFHGIKGPQIFHKMESKKQLSTLQKIILESLQIGYNHKYETDKALNGKKKGQQIGKGIYVTPHFQDAMTYTTPIYFQQRQYKHYIIILQCRVNPQAINICSQKEEYWVINNPEDIRHYGILILNNQECQRVQLNPAKREFFKYKNYQWLIEGNLDLIPDS